MRQLDAANISYTVETYEVDESDLSGIHIADQLKLDYGRMFKTIVTKGDKSGYLVFCIPCHREIDLKKAASVTNNKKVEPVPVKDLLGLTGYIRGGCSPIGMKKKFLTYFDRSVTEQETVAVSAGVRGMCLLVSSEDIVRFTDAKIADVTG